MGSGSAYMRAYRRQPKPRLASVCRRRAVQKLHDQHADELARLEEEERAKAGLPPKKR